MVLRQTQVTTLQLLLASHLMLLLTAARQFQQQAECSMELRGFESGSSSPNTKVGIAFARLHCRSGNATAVEVGINSALLGPFADQFTGVTVVNQHACQQQDQAGFSALLILCGTYNMTFVRPVVEGVMIEQTSAGVAWLSAVFAVGINASVSVIDGVFVGNAAGTIFAVMDNATVHLQSTNISSNTGHQGTAIYAQNAARVHVSNSTVSFNAAATEGGGIFASGNSTVHIDGQTSINSNRANQSGAGIRLTDQEFLLIHGNSSIEDNAVKGNGAGVNMDGSSSLLVERSRIFNNTAWEGFGGGIYISDSAAVSIIENSQVVHNTATYGGGLYALADSKVQVHLSTFSGNAAADLGTGGGLYIIDSSSAKISNSTIEYNSAWAGGGGVHIFGNLTLTNSVIRGNTVSRMNVATAGGILAEATAQVVVTSTLFGNNSAAIGGALYAKDHPRIEFQDVICSNNKAALYGGCAEVEGNATLIINRDSKVQNNTAREGAGVYAKNYASVTLVHSTVVANAAGNNGGGVSVLAPAALTLNHATIGQNIAAAKGGGVYMNGNATIDLRGTSVISANTAKWGGGVCLTGSSSFDAVALKLTARRNVGQNAADVSLAPMSLSIVGNTVINDFVSQLGTDESVLLVRLNVSGRYGMPCDGQVIQAQLNGTRALGVNRSDTSGLVVMRLHIRQPPGQYAVTFSLIPGDGPAPLGSMQPVNLTLHIRSCIPGEVMPAPDLCEVCGEGSYSLDPGSRNCADCPGGAVCPGGSVILPIDGFWHSAPDSVLMHKCPNPSACSRGKCMLVDQNSSAGCQAGLEYTDLQCAQGYRSNLCGTCAAGYGVVGTFQCQRCMSTAGSVFLFVLAFVVMGIFIRVMTYCAFAAGSSMRRLRAPSNSPEAVRSASAMGTRACGSTGQAARPSEHLPDATDLPQRPSCQQHCSTPLERLIILKTLVLYMQYALIISSLPGVVLPAPVAHALHVLGWFWAPASPVTLSPQCFLPLSSWVPGSIQIIVFYLCMPLAMLSVMLVLDAIAIEWSVRPCKVAISCCDMQTWMDRACTSTAVVGYVFAASIFRVGLSLFVCHSMDVSAPVPYTATTSFWVHDMQQECFRGYHRLWTLVLGVPLLSMTVCLPVLITVLVKRAHRQAGNNNGWLRYAFLGAPYKPSYCYWDAVVLLQTAAVVAVATLGYKLGPFHHTVSLSFVIAIFVVVWLLVQPMAVANETMLYALYSLLLATTAFLAYLNSDTAPGGSMRTVATGVAVLIVQGSFLLSATWHAVVLLGWEKVHISKSVAIIQHCLLTSLVCCASFPCSQVSGDHDGEDRSQL